MKRLFSLFLLLFLAFTNTGAQQLPHTLLWRISGNGLKQNAYLYGTMHLTDESVFQLGDSLYRAIEQSEGLAIEVNPEEMLGYLIEEIQQQIDQEHNISDVVDEHVYRKYGAALSKKLKKPADQITTRDIFREKNKWVTQSYKEGKMSTFLDAYLFDVARRLGKWTGGIEDMADQKNLVSLIDESDIREIAEDRGHNTNSLIRAYTSHDLDAINTMINLSDSSYIDALLIKRNHKMAARMDSLAQLRSMVFAVGAAHLPGKEGLIELLRARGFEVTPVFSARTLKPSEYKLKPIDIPWVEVKDANSYYTAMMPGKPGNLSSYGLDAMRMYFDIFNGTGYITFGLSMPYNQQQGDSVALAIANNVFKGKGLKKTAVTVSGIKGTELELIDGEGYKHGYVLHHDNIMYMAVAMATKRTAEAQKAMDKFLASFRILGHSTDTTMGAFVYTDSAKGFTLLLPARPVASDMSKNLGESAASIRSEMLISTDPQTGAYYFVGTNEARPGYYIPNDSNSIATIREGLSEQMKDVTKDSSWFAHGYRVLEFNGTTQESNVKMRTYYLVRGNRWYALIALYSDSKPDPGVTRFFRSFELLDYPQAAWQQQTSSDQLISTWAPAPIQYTPADSSDQQIAQYTSFDTIRADGYNVVVSELGKYFWSESDTAFWNTIVRNAIDDNDTLLSRKEVSNGKVKGLEIVLREQGSSSLQRKRILLYGEQLYQLLTMQPAAEIYRDDVNRFFEEFRFNKPSPPSTYLVSKAAVLLRDISSTDSATRAIARDELHDANFGVRDLEALHKAILRSYPSDTDYYTSTQELLARKLNQIDDPASLHFARVQYPQAQDPEIKNVLLQILLHTHTREHFTQVAKLLEQSPPLKTPDYWFTKELQDSLALTTLLLPAFPALLKDTVTAPPVIVVMRRMADSNFITPSMLTSYETALIAHSAHRLQVFGRDSNAYTYADYNLVVLLGKFNSMVANKELVKWSLLHQDVDLQQEAITQLLQNKQPVTAAAVSNQAANLSTRITCYNLLKKENQLALYPGAFATQKAFAEAMVYESAVDEDEEATIKIEYLNQKNYKFPGGDKRFYFFRVNFETEEENGYSMLGYAGPFGLSLSELSEQYSYGYVTPVTDFNNATWRAAADEMITELIAEQGGGD